MTTAQDPATVAMRAVIKQLSRWQLTGRQACVVLGCPNIQTFQAWAAGRLDGVDATVVSRMDRLVSICGALDRHFADPERGYQWLRVPSAAFDGRSPLERMLDGQLSDLAGVRDQLDAEELD